MNDNIDLLYAGPVSFTDHTDLQTLLDIGKAPLGWIGEFSPKFLLPISDFSGLPAGIAMYSELLTESNFQAAIAQARFLLKLSSNADFLDASDTKRQIAGNPSLKILDLKAFTSLSDLIQRVLPTLASPLSNAVSDANDSLIVTLCAAFQDRRYEDIEGIVRSHPTLPGAGLVLKKLSALFAGAKV